MQDLRAVEDHRILAIIAGRGSVVRCRWRGWRLHEALRLAY